MLGYLKEYWLKLLIASILMVGVSGTQALLAFLVKPVMDDIFFAGDINKLRLMPLAILVIFVFRAVCDYGRYYLMADAGQRIIMDIRNQIYFHLQKLSLPFFIKTPTGILISRITNDVNSVQASVTNAVTALIRELFTVIGLIFVVFYRDWKLALIAMVVFPAAIYPINHFGHRLKHYSTKSMKVMGDVMTLLDESISGIRIVKAYNMEEHEKIRFEKENRRYYRNWMRRLAIRAISTPMMELIGGIAIAFILWYGGMNVINGTSTTGNFFSFMTALFMLYTPIRKLNNVNIDIQEGIAAAKRVFEIIDTKPDIFDKPDALDLNRAKGDVEYRDVWFSYIGDKYALEGIRLHARPGNKIALVGESGAGKTTLVNLLPRFFDPTKGQILLDGNDVRDLTLYSLRKNIAMVTQEMILFNDSVKMNIAYGTENASEEDIIQAAKAANAHDFIENMSEGYETIIGEGGIRMSGGQRQRICIARAIIRNAPVLILDEATSSLDTESEREVHAAMDKLMADRTTLIIAHRLSTIASADWIIVLNKGEIVEQGSHDSLLKQDGYYTRLYNLQFGNA
ncbi:MAG: lipid A export permease/ATP-binding protein MsbA [Deltaproteobacteria bacterium]|nr:lipid A export permease/ATP-binding protein MsbA [Deltaproteobacteria bacterium]